MLAHEIRNPLLSIKGAAQLLGSTASADDAPLATLIVNEVARIDQLITTLDPLAEAPKKMTEPLNVHELLGHAQMAVKAALPQPVAFDILYDPSLPEVTGNRDQLVQALVNLMKNAAEAAELVAMPKITLNTRYVLGDARRNAAGVRLPIAIAVTDNGRGVPPAFVPNLFAPFATTKTSGRGLGLAITARIAEEHGGVVIHDVPEQGGARFTLYLPIAASGANPA
jgi:two-component system nitrogen regulation sensor histidine kinase GlnL